MVGSLFRSDLEQARDPATTAEVLRKLVGREAQPGVRAAVAANPNVPPDLLWMLAKDHPAEVLNNPSLELLSLEDPLWLQRPGSRVVYALMTHERAPAWFVEQVLSGPLPLREHIAREAQRPDVLWRLMHEADGSEEMLLSLVATNSHAPLSLLEHLVVERGCWWLSVPPRRLPAYCLEAVIESGLLKGHPGEGRFEPESFRRLPAHLHEQMAASPHEPLRLAVAHASSAQELLMRLARDPSLQVRAEVARNPHCPRTLAQALRQAETRRLRPSPVTP